ncbi:MAG TPA: haloalkane dehalogenase [Candidatus Limnocylindrales bacterium]|nr:haloalkane dehalogenase [Candidatus Limnocylindrales bacterium]
MLVLRTPQERFAAVRGFDLAPQHVELGGGLRMAYVEDGPPDGPPVVLLHGEPTWSYLYRRVIPVVAAAGCRVIAPDLIGFGRSDKPAEIGDHTYARHVEWVRAFLIDRLGLSDVTLVGHDWGGLIGLRVAAENPAPFARIVVTNTGLPTGEATMPEVWWRLRRWIETAPQIDVGRLVHGMTADGLAGEVLAAYDAPFPDDTYKTAVRAMPQLVPTTPEDPATQANRAAWAVLAAWRKPFLVAFSDNDPITGAMAAVFRRVVPGAAGLDHPVLPGGHFLQEECGEQLGQAIARFVRGSR